MKNKGEGGVGVSLCSYGVIRCSLWYVPRDLTLEGEEIGLGLEVDRNGLHLQELLGSEQIRVAIVCE